MTALQKQRIAALRAKGGSYASIAAALGVSQNTVQSHCRRNGLASGVKPEIKKVEENTAYCKECGAGIEQAPGRKPRKFCSDGCRRLWWKRHPESIDRKAVYQFRCAHCGEPFESYGNAGRRYCSHDCYVADRFGKAVTA